MDEKYKLKNGAVILVAGYTDQGKSTLVRKLMKDAGFVNNLAFDPRREYEKSENWIPFYDFDTFKIILYILRMIESHQKNS